MPGRNKEPASAVPDARDTLAGSSTTPPSLAAVVTTTIPEEAEAQRIAELVVQEQLAACAQVQGPIRSTFRWQGRLDHATEWYVHCKTSASGAPMLVARLKELHRYEVPEIIVTPIIGGYGPYLKWIHDEVR